MKKFWKKTEGFTLVELIVVIAILGILAGVGTVGYSGYVKKANIAADQQLVAVINQAFSAAYIENGVRVEDITNAEVDFIDTDSDTVNDTVTGLKTVTVNGDMATMAVRSTMGVKAQQIVDSFAKYYAGNEGGKFKIYDTMAYDAVAGKFIGYTSADGLASIAGGYRKDYTSASADYMADGTSYKGNEQSLIGTVTQFANAFNNFLTDGRVDKLMQDPAFEKFCKDNDIDTEDTEQIATSMVMYAAQELSDLNPTALHSAMKSAYNTDTGRINLSTLTTTMNGTNPTAADLALNGAVMAAVVAGFANSEYGKNNAAVQDAYAGYDRIANQTDLGNFVNNVIAAGKDDEGNDAFATYLNNQGAADMAAFTGGLGAVYHGTGDLLDAYGTADFNTLLVEILQGNWTPEA